MTRILVVHHDIDLADQEVESLRRYGYEARPCAGPTAGRPCPVYGGHTCWMADEADVLVYDSFAAGDGDEELLRGLRTMHPDKPVVVTSLGVSPDWPGLDNDPHVVLLTGAPTGARLAEAIERAIAG